MPYSSLDFIGMIVMKQDFLFEASLAKTFGGLFFFSTVATQPLAVRFVARVFCASRVPHLICSEILAVSPKLLSYVAWRCRRQNLPQGTCTHKLAFGRVQNRRKKRRDNKRFHEDLFYLASILEATNFNRSASIGTLNTS